MYCGSYGVQQTIRITAKHFDTLNEYVAQPNHARALEPLIEVVPKVYRQGCHNGVFPECRLPKTNHLKSGESISNTVIESRDMQSLKMDVEH